MGFLHIPSSPSKILWLSQAASLALNTTLCLQGSKEEYVPEAYIPLLKKQTKTKFPCSQTYLKVLTPNSCCTRDLFYQLLHLQFCPTALLHPGKIEQATQEQTINCDLFHSIHLIHNRLGIPVRLSGKLFGLVCIYQELPIV